MQAILLLAEGIYVYGVYTYSIYSISESGGLIGSNPTESFNRALMEAGARDVVSLTWAAVPILGGLGMVSLMNFESSDLSVSEVAFAVQSFYAYRLRILARSWVIVIFIIVVRCLFSLSSVHHSQQH